MHETAIVARAKALFGVTRNPLEAGYILADGTMLDLSGRHQVGDYVRSPSGENVLKRANAPDYMQDTRMVDHREVNDLYELSSGGVAMLRFMVEAGALRFHPKVGFDVAAIPTSQQVAKALAAHFTLTSDPIHVDVTDPQSGQLLDSKEFSRQAAGRVIPFIKQSFGAIG